MTNTHDRHKEFESEMLPHTDMIYNYALYLTGSKEQAADLLQETFMKAYRFLDRFERGTNAKAWLHRIMRNTYINEYRKIKRIPELVTYDEQISAYQMRPGTALEGTNIGNMIEMEMFGDELATAIAALPEKFKSIVILRDVEDMPYEEIAEVLKIPIGTVRSRLHRARAMLFDRLKEHARRHGYNVENRFAGGEVALA